MAALSMLEGYQVSPTNAFLPAEPPLRRLPKYYESWETICSDLPALIQSGQIIDTVDELQLCSTDLLTSEPEWRRAYVLLGFMANAYLWGPERPANRLPASLSIPFLAVSEHLEIPPFPTYAAQNLWNVHSIDPTQPMHDPANIHASVSFTGAPDETWFFAVPAAIEARGAPMISLALEAFEAASSHNAKLVINCLNQISGHLDGCTHILPRMYERNNPIFFYNRIRPFLSGRQISPGLSHELYYEEEDGKSRHLRYKGPTAAQSSLWQFVDIALGISHDDEVILEMRQSMPGSHRRFLAHVAKIANIREYVTSHPQESGLHAAFNMCLESLVAFRNKHLQMVSRYIVVPSRAPSKAFRKNNNESVVINGAAKGTGGTAPVEFLKQVRDETRESRLRG